MKIAIVGAGFSGMAVAFHLVNSLKASITLFDPAGIGGGASGIAAGLLHTYAGLHCKLNYKGKEGYEATIQLLQAAAQSHNQQIFFKSGLIRIAVTDLAITEYDLCAESFPDVRKLTPDEITHLVPGAVHRPGIVIDSALTIYTDAYLQGLWKFCQNKGCCLELTAIHSLQELKSFDLIVISAGAAAVHIRELSHLPLTPIKGQLLELEWPDHLPPPKAPLNSQAYLVMNPDGRSCILGATFERRFTHSKPDLQTAVQDILPKGIAMIPALKDSRILNCRSGIRASTPDHKPYLKKIGPNCWILTGMGSKGLLYHALYAQKLAKEILNFITLNS